MGAAMGDDLVGTVWFHAYEEDDEARIVYRSSAHDFPRSRRPRESLSLEPDGRLLAGRGGPADKLIQSPGRWSIKGEHLTLQRSSGAEVYEIETATQDKLVLRRQMETDE